MILADLYGPQTVLSGGQLPPELAFAHPGFLRPCHRVRVPYDVYLHLYATHLARGPDGRWRVLADRTQTPFGRRVRRRESDHHLADVAQRVSRLPRAAAGVVFHLGARNITGTRGPSSRQSPDRVAQPRPNESHIFRRRVLARYLGYTLVEGGDLTVRDNRVFLKTLGGLIPTDVILRRIFDEECDPLELQSDSRSGVPGLLQAVRSGNVVVANAMGSGLLEAPALMAYLPRWPGICWARISNCLRWRPGGAGGDDSLNYVLDHLEQLVVKPAFTWRAERPIFGAQLSAAERTALTARIKAAPREFVGQQWVQRSTAPVLTASGTRPWHVALRTFLVASKQEYKVMPGGLVRVSASGERLSESTLAGEGSKDVWVLSDGPVTPVSLLHPRDTPVPLRRSGNDLPSRVADNLYWLGRHVERAESAIRLIAQRGDPADERNRGGQPAGTAAAAGSLGRAGAHPARIRRPRRRTGVAAGGAGNFRFHLRRQPPRQPARHARRDAARRLDRCATGFRSIAGGF